MPSFLPHRISPPSKLVVLNQACFDLPTASSEERKWGDDEEVEVADNEDSSRRLDKGKAPMESLVKLNQSCVELPTSSSERRKWGDDCFEEEAESDEDGCAQITMDFREPRSPVGSIDSDTPIVRLDANILHPRALRMLGFTTKEGLEFEGMTEALTTMFRDPADYVLETPRARPVMKQLDRTQEVHSQVSSSSSFTTSDTVSVQTPSATPHRQIIPSETVKVLTPTYNAAVVEADVAEPDVAADATTHTADVVVAVISDAGLAAIAHVVKAPATAEVVVSAAEHSVGATTEVIGVAAICNVSIQTGKELNPKAKEYTPVRKIPYQTSTKDWIQKSFPMPIKSLVTLNQASIDIPSSGSGSRRWGDDDYEVAENDDILNSMACMFDEASDAGNMDEIGHDYTIDDLHEIEVRKQRS
ncbi:hypothetical protein K7X08_034083 [Anisodus acutangulus]|uniref:Uncharacterized protein n=1 Tax=Anisodus acutangulus TaxID=402998 RepID=A0A9Q1RJ07_9SOLA|nr:hypothetical protein K7X08_034083 [Anisodus acutangulus]